MIKAYLKQLTMGRDSSSRWDYDRVPGYQPITLEIKATLDSIDEQAHAELMRGSGRVYISADLPADITTLKAKLAAAEAKAAKYKKIINALLED